MLNGHPPTAGSVTPPPRSAPISKVGRIRALVAILSVVALASSCADALEDRVLTVEGTGAITGLVYIDLNGDSVLGGGDGRAQGLVVSVGYPGVSSKTAIDTTREDGFFSMSNVPVGRVEFRLDPAFLGDSLKVVQLSSDQFTLTASDPANLVIGLAYPSYSVADARNRPQGSALFINGTVLSPRTGSVNGMIFVRGAGKAVRITRVPFTTLVPGDSVRVRGHISTASGQPVVEAQDVIALFGSGTPPQAIPLSTFQASHAMNGALDADLVQVVNAMVMDTSSVDDDRLITINDGSGPLVVRLMGEMGVPAGSLQPGLSTFAIARGTLLFTSPGPGGTPRWVLLPRSSNDLSVVTPPAPPSAN